MDIIKNATSIIMTSIAFITFFILFTSIAGVGMISITWDELVLYFFGSAAVSLGVAAIVATGLSFFGPAGEFSWKIALFTLVSLWAAYISAKMIAVFPPEVPTILVLIFALAPVAGLIWAVFEAWMKSR